MFKNHPKGLAIIFFTEMWERFGFYIMMSIFVLYMDKEFGWTDSQKGDFYGWFLGAVYFIPVLGGWIGDRLLGQIKTIILGAVLMVFGYIALAFSSLQLISFFYIGLFLVAFGTGVFKVNMSVLVGNLYKNNVHLKDAGYNIYYMGVNLGALIAPLAATVISIMFHSYNISFAAASVGMLASLVIFLRGKKILYSIDTNAAGKFLSDNNAAEKEPVMSEKEERQRVVTLCVLFVIVIFFWVGFYQNGFALTLFAERSTIKSDILRPETYQSFNPFFILLFTPLLVTFFSKLRKKEKEPSTPVKIFIGMIIMGSSMLIMTVASLSGGNHDINIMSPMWLIVTYLVVTLSEIHISPMGMSYVSKVAPPKIQGLMMGLWFGATAVGSFGSGLLGKFYSNFAHHEYFLILFGLLIFSAVLVLIFLKRLKIFSV